APRCRTTAGVCISRSRASRPNWRSQGRTRLRSTAPTSTNTWSGSGSLRSFRRVEGGFDVVPVGVEDESAVVMRMVLRPQAGRAVVAAAGAQGRVVEGAHL